MAPHWKCGLGQPIAGSNPALSATASGRPMFVVRRIDREVLHGLEISQDDYDLLRAGLPEMLPEAIAEFG